MPDPDLGELKVPEPPLVHQVGPEEIDLFVESTDHTKNETADKPEHQPDEGSTCPSLVGAWSGNYQWQRSKHSSCLVSLSITEQKADGAFEGAGIDRLGAFILTGTITSNKVNFTKSYTASYLTRRYIGVLNTEMTEIDGRWGPSDMEDDVAPFSAVEGNGPCSHPVKVVDGNGPEDQELSKHAPLCDIEITIDRPNGMENGKEVVDDKDGVSEAGSIPSSTRTGALEVLVPRGPFSLVRRPVDYFLCRPSDAEFQESRPKALWKMVRNAARQWYCSHHLIWDTLRERRDRRNRYMELLLKQEQEGMLYDSEDAAEWVKIIQQTHPNDARLWRAITDYKETRKIPQLYVSLIPYLELSGDQTNALDSRASCDHCKKQLSNSRLVCSDCTVGGWSNSIDLCGDCWSSDCSRERDNKHHISTHLLVQFRRPVFRMEHYGLFRDAKMVVEASVEKLSAVSELSCTICHKAISEKPFWCCLVCDGTLSIS